MLNSFFSNTILSWFRENGRSLPWRETKDPYAIWLSEIILQQTRIAQGWEYWERFMEAYPTVEDLAEASEDDVLKLWQGLGYYSRARNLHAAAKQIVALGKFPDTLDGIKALKGVGDYTAAAIGSFAFDIPAAVVDGNVYRVLSRYFGIDTPINSPRGKKEFAALAQSLLPVFSSFGENGCVCALSEKILPNGFSMELSAVSAYNQGMMDFGAIQCTPQSPKCLLCPLVETCEAMRQNQVNELPVKQKTVKVSTRYLTYVYIRCKEGITDGEADGKVDGEAEGKVDGESTLEPMIAIHRRGEGDIWQGLWEPYNASIHEEKSAANVREIEKMLRLPNPSFANSSSYCQKASVPKLSLLAKGVKHVLTHRILLADFYLLEISQRPSLSDDYIWIQESDMEKYGVPRLIEIMLGKINER